MSLICWLLNDIAQKLEYWLCNFISTRAATRNQWKDDENWSHRVKLLACPKTAEVTLHFLYKEKKQDVMS